MVRLVCAKAIVGRPLNSVVRLHLNQRGKLTPHHRHRGLRLAPVTQLPFVRLFRVLWAAITSRALLAQRGNGGASANQTQVRRRRGKMHLGQVQSQAASGAPCRSSKHRAKGEVQSNNTFERTVKHRGRTVLAMDCALAGAEMRRWPAAQLGR
jgi:hypothetical protein